MAFKLVGRKQFLGTSGNSPFRASAKGRTMLGTVDGVCDDCMNPLHSRMDLHTLLPCQPCIKRSPFDRAKRFHFVF